MKTIFTEEGSMWEIKMKFMPECRGLESRGCLSSITLMDLSVLSKVHLTYLWEVWVQMAYLWEVLKCLGQKWSGREVCEGGAGRV